MKATRIIKFLIIFLMIVPFMGAVTYFLNVEVKEDGSGTLKVSYWTKASEIKDGIAGGYSFSPEKVKTIFSSDNNLVGNVKVTTLKNDTTYASFDVAFKDITKLSSAKGFSNWTSKWTKEQDGTINFACTIAGNPEADSQLAESDMKIYYVFTFPGEILKANGYKDGSRVTFTRKASEMGNDFVMSALIDPKGTVSSDINKDNKTEEKKSCGLFGIELPVVIFLGLFYMVSTRNKKVS